MIQDPNVERLIRKSIEPLNKQISMLQIELEGVKKQLAIPRVSNSLPEDEIEYMKGVICELIEMHEHPELSNDDWKKAVIDVAKEKGYGNDC